MFALVFLIVISLVLLFRSRSQTTLTSFLSFFDHLPPSVDIFYLIKVDKTSTFLDYLPPTFCNRSLWTIHLAGSNKNRHSFKNLAEDGTLNGKGANLCNSVPNIENGRMVCKNYGNGGKKCSPICNDGHQFYQKVAEQFIPRHTVILPDWTLEKRALSNFPSQHCQEFIGT